MQFCRPGSLLRIFNPNEQAWVPSTVTAMCKDDHGQPYAITVAHAFQDVPAQTEVSYCIRYLKPGASEERRPLGLFACKVPDVVAPDSDLDIAAVGVTWRTHARTMPYGTNAAPRLFPWSRLPDLFARLAHRPVMAWFQSGMRQDRTWGRLHMARYGSRTELLLEVRDHKWLFGDSGSPVYIWEGRVLYLMGMIQSAQNIKAGAVRYRLLDIHAGLATLRNNNNMSLQL